MVEIQDWKDLLKTEKIGYLGSIEIVTKNIVLFSGPSMAGKTISCLHIVDSSIKMGKKVLYFDTENKSIMTRAEPNLFRKFYGESKEEYDKLFFYKDSLDDWVDHIKEIKPNLIIIDSLYTPFLTKYPQQRSRAKIIKEFLLDFRAVLWESEMGAVITVPTGRVINPSDGIVQNVALGGEGVKYLADIKIMISCADINGDLEKENRFFLVDRNITYAFKIGYGGILEEVKNDS